MDIELLLDIEPKHLAIVKHILATYLPSNAVWAYGSRVKFTAHKNSDLDLVAFDAAPNAIADAVEAFENSALPYKVSIMLWEKIPADFQANISQKYVIINEPALKEHIDRGGMELYSRWKGNKTIDTPYGTIAEDWSYIPSLQFCSKITDGTHDSPKQQKAGKHLVTSKHIKGRNIDFETAYLISEKDFDNINLRSKVEQWDVIVSMIGEYCGFTYVERNESIDYAVKNVGLFKTGREHKALWLFYYLNSKIGRHILEINKSGTSQPYLTLGFLRELPILYPSSIVEANHIVQILSSLDDKIDLLHRQNKTLEQLAETLFRQWFVEEAEESWEEITLSEIAIHSKENMHPSKNPAKIFKHYSLPSFDAGKEPINEIGKEILSNKYKVISNSILVSKLNPRTPRIWMIYGTVNEDECICSTEFQIVKPKDQKWYGFIYCFLKSNLVTQELAGASSGTSGSHQRVNPQDIFNLTFLKPADTLIVDFSKIIDNYFAKINNNQTQIRTLTQTRDTLLPKLMSGEVRVLL